MVLSEKINRTLTQIRSQEINANACRNLEYYKDEAIMDYSINGIIRLESHLGKIISHTSSFTPVNILKYKHLNVKIKP